MSGKTARIPSSHNFPCAGSPDDTSTRVSHLLQCERSLARILYVCCPFFPLLFLLFLHQVLITSRAAYSDFFFHPAFAARSRRFSFLSGDSLSDGCEQKRASISCRFRNCFAVLPRLIPTLVIRHPRYFFSAGNKNTNCWDSPFSLFSFPPLRHPFRLFR